MIDGRPVLSLSSLPIAAVERIEFINDGASALHAGGNGGAINIVLRRDIEGAIAWAGAERPGNKGGAIENVGGMWSGKVGRGRLTDRRRRFPARRDPQKGPGLQPARPGPRADPSTTRSASAWAATRCF